MLVFLGLFGLFVIFMCFTAVLWAGGWTLVALILGAMLFVGAVRTVQRKWLAWIERKEHELGIPAPEPRNEATRSGGFVGIIGGDFGDL